MLLSPSLHQLTYHSVATQPLTAAELAELLRQARDYNHAHRLTGLLLYAAETAEFLQVLEGPRAVLHALYARIVRDPRHWHVFTLSENGLTTRSFPDWRMAFVAVTGPEMRQLTGYVPLQRDEAFPLGLAAHPPDDLRRLLTDFATRATDGQLPA